MVQALIVPATMLRKWRLERPIMHACRRSGCRLEQHAGHNVTSRTGGQTTWLGVVKETLLSVWDG